MAESVNGRQKEAPKGRLLKQILKGEDPEMIAMLQRQIPLILLVIVFILCYIGNRYSSQRDQIAIEKLKKELNDVQYQALNITSDVSARSKASYIESVVGSNGSGLETSAEPLFTLRK
ncbi:MAG: hypothetical protein MJY79_04510 [Bacteroidaceae bacterium]|nr:hypothetical protein [Bacteroidaceae bacterium]